MALAGAGGRSAERVKDLASVAGVRGNQLVGYGLVVGLDGTGDQTSQAPFTVQSIKNMLAQLRRDDSAERQPAAQERGGRDGQADLPAFAKPGQTIDVTVSSIGNATSLRGGTLLMTPLRGVDGEVYAIAQGNLIVSGFGVKGGDGSSIAVNVPSAGRVPNGATVERGGANELRAARRDAQSALAGFHDGDAPAARINACSATGTAHTVDAVSVRGARAGRSQRSASPTSRRSSTSRWNPAMRRRA